MLQEFLTGRYSVFSHYFLLRRAEKYNNQDIIIVKFFINLNKNQTN
jgi:hypothetical protein